MYKYGKHNLWHAQHPIFVVVVVFAVSFARQPFQSYYVLFPKFVAFLISLFQCTAVVLLVPISANTQKYLKSDIIQHISVGDKRTRKLESTISRIFQKVVLLVEENRKNER